MGESKLKGRREAGSRGPVGSTGAALRLRLKSSANAAFYAKAPPLLGPGETRNSFRFYDRKRVKLNQKRLGARAPRDLVEAEMSRFATMSARKTQRRMLRKVLRLGGKPSKFSFQGLPAEADYERLRAKIVAYAEG